MSQLVFAAARQLRIDHTQIKRLDIKKRSVDARKKNDVRLIYTVDVLVKGREDKILKTGAQSESVDRTGTASMTPPKPEASSRAAPRGCGLRSGRHVLRAGSGAARAANRSF